MPIDKIENQYYIQIKGNVNYAIYSFTVLKDCSQINISSLDRDCYIDINYEELKAIRAAISEVLEAHEIKHNLKVITDFKVGDTVNTPFGVGVVWKVTEKGIHVKHYNHSPSGSSEVSFSKYLFNINHHSQNPISDLTLQTINKSNKQCFSIKN